MSPQNQSEKEPVIVSCSTCGRREEEMVSRDKGWIFLKVEDYRTEVHRRFRTVVCCPDHSIEISFHAAEKPLIYRELEPPLPRPLSAL